MELLIVIAIIAILAVAFVPNALKAPAKARDVVRIKKIQDVQTAVESHLAETGQMVASNVSFCLTNMEALPMGLDAAPNDSSELNSCEKAGSEGDYFYRAVTVGADRFYIIGAKVEVPTSGNTRAVISDAGDGIPTLKTVADLAAAKALVEEGLDDATYFIAVGPR